MSAIDALGAEIEAAVANTALSEAGRASRLRELRVEVVALLGRIDTYAADNDLVREAQAARVEEAIAELYETAAYASAAIQRGMADPLELRNAGVLFADELDAMHEEGLLEAAAIALVEAGLRKAWDKAKHPKGRGGLFIETYTTDTKAAPKPASKSDKAPSGRGGAMPAGRGAQDRGGKAGRPTRRATSRLETKRTAGARPDYQDFGLKPPSAIVFPKDRKPLPGEPSLDDEFLAATHALALSDWPERSEAAAKLLGDKENTLELHKQPDGSLTPERQRLHAWIVQGMLREWKDPDHPNFNGPRLQPSDDPPIALFMAGGTASGKSSALRLPENASVRPDSAVVINPDVIKEHLPEYQELLAGGDPDAATVVHEESSALAKRLMAEALDRGLNVIVDGTLDGGEGKEGKPSSTEAKLRAAKDGGYEVRVFYASAPMQVAMVQSVKRANEEGREVPLPEIESQHQRVSQRFMDVVQPLVEEGLIDDVRGYEVMGVVGGPDHQPALLFRGGKGSLDIGDREAYERFVAKADNAWDERYWSPGKPTTGKSEPAAAGAAAGGKAAPDAAAGRPAKPTGTTTGESIDKGSVSAAAQTEEPSAADYQEQAMRNLMATSRTASGTLDLSASKTKAASIEAISGEDAAVKAKQNFTRAVEQAHEARDKQFESPEDTREFFEGLAGTINEGIVKKGALIRSGEDSTKYPYTKIADLDEAMDDFYEEMHERLNDPNADPVETAAFAEYRIDLTDHFFADGCGKSAKLAAAYVLMRAGLPLPKYTNAKDYYKSAPKVARGTSAKTDAEQWDRWLSYYRTLVSGDSVAKGGQR